MRDDGGGGRGVKGSEPGCRAGVSAYSLAGGVSEEPATGRCSGTGFGGVAGAPEGKDPAMACNIVNDVCLGSTLPEAWYKIGGGGTHAARL